MTQKPDEDQIYNSISMNLGEILLDTLSKNPEKSAFRFSGKQISRGQLKKESSDLAEIISKRGLNKGEPVAIEIEHSFSLVIALYATIIAGGCAVPIDPLTSLQRKSDILRDITPRFILQQNGTGLDSSGTSESVSIVETNDSPFDLPESTATTDSTLAFIIYTSGSSGGPKGVEITHENYVKRLLHIVSEYSGESQDIDLAWTPSSFIGMLDEFFFSLLMFVPIVLANPKDRQNPKAIASLIESEGVTMFRIAPSLLEVFLVAGVASSLQNIRAIFCSGETLSENLQREVYRQLPASIIGFYGATEAPGIAYHAYNRDEPLLKSTVCTVQPFAKLKVVSQYGHLLAYGEIGEIWVSSFAVAHGYWKQAELTAQKFITANDERWYRTGDLGKQIDRTRFEILGRVDHNDINLRGVRVNLPEIRSALQTINNVERSWISVCEGSTSSRILVAHYVITKGLEFDSQVIKKELASLLPPQAIPRFFIRHDELPLTSNGKLNIQQLLLQANSLVLTPQLSIKKEKLALTKNHHINQPKAETLVHENDATVVTGSVAEQNLCPQELQSIVPVVLNCVEHILRIKDLTGADNFLDLGGDSLLAVKFSLLLADELNVEIDVNAIFSAKTFTHLAEQIVSGEAHQASIIKTLRNGQLNPPLVTINATGSYYALKNQLAGTYSIYNLNIFGLTNDLIGKLQTFSLKDLAERLADELHQSHPTGPYRLMAFCQDGGLAIELARTLQNRHGYICELFLIDTLFSKHQSDARLWVDRLLKLGPSYFLKKLFSHVRRRPTTENLLSIPHVRAAAIAGKKTKDDMMYKRYTDLFMAYRPQAYAGAATLFLSKDWRHGDLSDVRGLSGERLTIINTDALHDTFFEARSIYKLANAIDQAIS
jgi:acyl-CoA synthetase (AMP-forming)/AMP-acid ligase II/thioesterase domain-containing protein/acyl carrier protein